MSKKLNNMKWESVALDGFPASMTDKFQGFVGLEECTDYSFDKEGKRSKKVCLFLYYNPFYNNKLMEVYCMSYTVVLKVV